MALNHDADGFLVGDVIPEIKRMNKVSDSIRKDVAAIKRYLKMSVENRKNPPAPTPDRTQSQNKTERTRTERSERTRRTVEPRQRDSRGRFIRANENSGQSDITQRETIQAERQRDANGRFTSENRKATVEPNGRKRNSKGQFESSADKSFLSNAFDSLGDKITGAIALGTGGMEEVDPTVKAFQEVAEPLSRGYQFMFGSKDDKRDKKYFGWLGKIWKSVRKTENNTEESSRESGGGLLGSLMTGLMGGGGDNGESYIELIQIAADKAAKLQQQE